MDDFTSLLPIKHLPISASNSGDNTLIAANADKAYRILGLHLSGSGTVTALVKDGSSGTVLAAFYLTAANNVVLPISIEGGWAQGTKNTALILNLSGATAVQGAMRYQEV